MARPVYEIKLSGAEKHDLRQAKKKGRTQARLVLRILIILLADQGKTLAATAQSLGCCEQTVLNQRKRFLARRAEGAAEALQDLPRSGRPVVYTAPQRALITATVCETLKEHDLPLSRLSTADLLRIICRQDGLAGSSHDDCKRASCKRLPRAVGDRIEVIVHSHEPTVAAAVFFASARQPFAVREWHLEEDGILILCKCEKRPCPQHDMIFAPLDVVRIEAQIEREIHRLCAEYGVPFQRVRFFTHARDNFLSMSRLALRGEWKEEQTLSAAREEFHRRYK